MSDNDRTHSFLGDFRRFFGRGLGILLPSIVTLWLLYQVFVFLFNNVAQPINYGIRSTILWSIDTFVDDPESQPQFFRTTPGGVSTRVDLLVEQGELTPEEVSDNPALAQEKARESLQREQLRRVWEKEYPLLQLSGLVLAIILIYLAGLLLGNYIGRRLYTRVERLISRVPGFKQVYPHVKQVVDLIFGDSPMKAFSEVVMVQYPREQLWSIGFVTGEGYGEIRDAMDGEDVVSIFVPTSPTPMTGFVINARRSEIRSLDMTVDQALRFVITAGVLTPETIDKNPELAQKMNGPVSAIGDPAAQKPQSPRTPPRSSGPVTRAGSDAPPPGGTSGGTSGEDGRGGADPGG